MAPQETERALSATGRTALAAGRACLFGEFPNVASSNAIQPPQTPPRTPDATTPNIELEKGGTSAQREFWNQRNVWKESIVAKLNAAGCGELAGAMAACGTYETILQCQSCGKPRVVWNHCDRTGCPVCADRLARKKRDKLKAWAGAIAQPKHVVLTQKNCDSISKETFAAFKTNLKRLRRSDAFAKVRGGCWSIEVTNEGNGWHLHAHLLVDADWIPFDLAKTWAKIIGQEVAIIKVKDCRAKEYVQEVIKYAAKGSEIAAWSGPAIAEFMTAVRDTRLFATFGTLYKDRAKVRAAIKKMALERGACECGCNRWKSFTPDAWSWHQIQKEGVCNFLDRTTRSNVSAQAVLASWAN
jgi:Replication protein